MHAAGWFRKVRSEHLLVAIIAIAVYWVAAVITNHTATPDTAYFNQLADAFLHGRLHLGTPTVNHDLTQHNGNWYVPFPPLAAIMMMPFVSVFGLAHMNTVVFAVIVGGINVAFMSRLLSRLTHWGVVDVPQSIRRWLVVAYAVGSVHLYMATQGTVWFVAHLVAAVFVLAAMNAAVERRGILAGVLLGIACLSRPTVFFMVPVMVGLYLGDRSKGHEGPEKTNGEVEGAVKPNLIAAATRIAVPAAAIALLLLAYNRARFGKFTEFGYSGENVAPRLADDLATWGQFNPHFIVHNVWAMFFAGPNWGGEPLSAPKLSPNPEGMSIFLTTPIFGYAFRASRRAKLTLWSWAAIGLMLIPLLTYYNTGWYQFGSRFSLDFMPALFVLMAIGIGSRLSWIGSALIVFGIAVNFWGLAWFN
jgi:hypothetical protein